MFLAPARHELSIYEMAQVQARFLEAEAGTEPPARQNGREKTAEVGVASPDRLGMSVEERGDSCQTRARVPGERMRSVELFTGAGGLALGIERAGFHHDTVV